MTEVPNPNIDTDTLTGDLRPVRRAVLSIGSNLGDRLQNLQDGLDSLADTPEVWITDVSGVYETDPVDAPEESADYLNAVVFLDTTLGAHTLLDRALAIEIAYGRERTEVRNTPRTLDIDLIAVGDRRIAEERLTIPHPRAKDRAFVLAPWHELDPQAELPGEGRVSALLDRVGPQGIRRREDLDLTAQP